MAGADHGKEVMRKLVETGGKVPDGLRHGYPRGHYRCNALAARVVH